MYYLVHTPSVKIGADVHEEPHILANIEWFQDHPCKFEIGSGSTLSSCVCQLTYSASFTPVSRIISQCAVVDEYLKFDYGENHVIVALPLRCHILMSD